VESEPNENTSLLTKSLHLVEVKVDEKEEEVDNVIKDIEDGELEIDPYYVFLLVLSRIIPIVFTLFALFCAAAIIIGILYQKYEKDFFYEIFCLIAIFAVISAYGVYKWGVVEGQIRNLRKENQIFSKSNMELENTGKQLTAQVDRLKKSIPILRKSIEDLDAHAHEFDDLKKQLIEIAGDNEHMHQMIDNLNEIFNDLQRVTLENEKAALYDVFYDVELRHKNRGLNADDYDQFLARLPTIQREKFEKVGDFKSYADKNGILQIREFQQMVSKYLSEVDEMILKQNL